MPYKTWGCKICGAQAPTELRKHGKFQKRMEWLRRHRAKYHPRLASKSIKKAVATKIVRRAIRKDTGRMTIYEIKRRTEGAEPYFFSRNTMKFFKQTLKDFRVYKQSDGKYLIRAKMPYGYTERLFNPKTNRLEHVKH